MKTKYFRIVDSCTKYFVAGRQCKGSPLFCFTLLTATFGAKTGRKRIVTFPLRHWLRERSTMLRYTYVNCLVFNLFLIMQGLVPSHGFRSVDLS